MNNHLTATALPIAAARLRSAFLELKPCKCIFFWTGKLTLNAVNLPVVVIEANLIGNILAIECVYRFKKRNRKLAVFLIKHRH
jgi:hypothetical protein